MVEAEADEVRDSRVHRHFGRVAREGTRLVVTWEPRSGVPPTPVADGVYVEHKGATLTARAFDQVLPGLGRGLVATVARLFALSTMIGSVTAAMNPSARPASPRFARSPIRVVR